MESFLNSLKFSKVTNSKAFIFFQINFLDLRVRMLLFVASEGTAINSPSSFSIFRWIGKSAMMSLAKETKGSSRR